MTIDDQASKPRWCGLVGDCKPAEPVGSWTLSHLYVHWSYQGRESKASSQAQKDSAGDGDGRSTFVPVLVHVQILHTKYEPRLTT